jgi:hypothetical protein
MPNPPTNNEWLRDFIRTRRWQFAKTMSHIPHEYTVRDWRPEAINEFELVVEFIRKNGMPERFWSKTFIYYYLDGYKYWTMGSPVQETRLINRAKYDQAGRTQRTLTL